MPKFLLLPFLTDFMCGSRSFFSFLVELDAVTPGIAYGTASKEFFLLARCPERISRKSIRFQHEYLGVFT